MTELIWKMYTKMESQHFSLCEFLERFENANVFDFHTKIKGNITHGAGINPPPYTKYIP